MRDLDENLARFRYHTGATLRRLAPGGALPAPLSRHRAGGDGPLSGRSARAARWPAGADPLQPDCGVFQEPYRDYEPVGRLVFLKPRELRPWFSGVANVYVASVPRDVASVTVGFLPAHVDPGLRRSSLGGGRELVGPARRARRPGL